MCFALRNSVVEYVPSFTEGPQVPRLGILEDSRIQPRPWILREFGPLHCCTIYTSDLRVLESQGSSLKCLHPPFLEETNGRAAFSFIPLKIVSASGRGLLGTAYDGARRQQQGGGVWIWLWNFLIEIPPLKLPTPLRISGYHPLPALRILLPLLAGTVRKHAHRSHNSWISRQIINWGNDGAASGIHHLSWPNPLHCLSSPLPHLPFSHLLNPDPSCGKITRPDGAQVTCGNAGGSREITLPILPV